MPANAQLLRRIDLDPTPRRRRVRASMHLRAEGAPMHLPRTLLVAVTGIALLTAACGGDDDTSSDASSDETRTMEVDMVDTAFQPETLEVSQGETIRFVFTNEGEVAHDAFIGDRHAQDEHE